MLKSEKAEFVSKLQSLCASNNSIVLVKYHGLSVRKLDALRKSLSGTNSGFIIVKNTLARIVMENLEYSSAKSLFKGPIAVAYSNDVVALAKVLVGFAKEHQAFCLVGGMLSGSVLDVKSVELISSLPSIDVLRGKIVGLLQAPASGLMRVVNAPSTQVARVLSAYSNK